MSNRVMLKVVLSAIAVIGMYLLAFLIHIPVWRALDLYMYTGEFLWVMIAVATIVNLLLLLAIWWNREPAEV